MFKLKQGTLPGSLRAVLGLLAVASAFSLGAERVFAQATPPAKPCEPPPAKAASVQGTVEVRRVAETQWQTVQLNATFCPGDSIRV